LLSNTATSPSSTSVGAAIARMVATMPGKRRVWSTPCRLTSFTAAPALWATMRQPSTFSS